MGIVTMGIVTMGIVTMGIAPSLCLWLECNSSNHHPYQVTEYLNTLEHVHYCVWFTYTTIYVSIKAFFGSLDNCRVTSGITLTNHFEPMFFTFNNP